MAESRGLLKTSVAEHIANRKQQAMGPSVIHKFPKNIGAHGTLMQFFDYSYGGVKGSERKPRHAIMLPLPRQINDSFKINVGSDELGILGTAAANLAGGNFNDTGAAFNKLGEKFTESVGSGMDALSDAASGKSKIGDMIKDAASGTMDAGLYLLRSGLGKVAADIEAGIGAGRGTAVNPFATLAFKGVDLKVHSLEWLLSPESEEEQKELKKIIRIIQNNILPEASSPLGDDNAIGLTVLDKGLLKYPSMVNIYLQGLDQEYYFRFKTSMISQFNVDYTPNGVAINKGGKPSAIRLTMTLNEAFIHTKSEYDYNDMVETEVAQEVLQQVEEDTTDDDAPRQDVVTTGTGEIPTDAPVLAADEVRITTTNADGSLSVSVQSKADILKSTGSTQQDLEASVNPVYLFGVGD